MRDIVITKADRPDHDCKCMSCGQPVQHGEEIVHDGTLDQSRHLRCVPVPTVHLNGSGRARLQEEQSAIVDAARKLLDVMAEGAPNARDYYPQGDDAYLRARKRYDERMREVCRIRDDAGFTLMFLVDGDS